MTILWLVGEPGVGKTAVARRMLELNGPFYLHPEEKQKWTVTESGVFVAAGHYSGQMFDGADTIGYGAVRDHLEFWQQTFTETELTMIDGDRFSYQDVVAFFKRVVPHRRRICCHFTGPAEERRLQRGSAQNESWIKGRITKSKNFSEKFDGDVFEVDTTTDSPDEIANSILEIE